MNNTCIIIPIYNVIPTESEIISIKRNTSILKDYSVFAIYPEGMSLKEYEGFPFKDFIPFGKEFFSSNKSYSRLLLSKQFYIPFLDYEYMLIAQTDTYILNTEYTLEQFVEMGYDYIGAPWTDGPLDKPYGLKGYIKMLFVPGCQKLKVGNGGFSLRNISACKEAIWNNQFYLRYIFRFNEDLFFSSKLTNKPDIETASRFALETNMQEEIEKGNYPYGLHAFEKHLKGDVEKIRI